MLLDVFPDVVEVNKVEIQFDAVICGYNFVLDGVGIWAVVDLLISLFEITNEAVSEGSGALWG